MYNNPSGTMAQVTIGPGIVYLGADGTTPTVDIGYVKGNATLKIERQQVEIRQGSPQTIVDALVKQEDVTIEFTGIQWNLDNLLRLLGDGVTSVDGASDLFKVGGTPDVDKHSLKFVHKMADGGTLEVDMWSVIGEGVLEATVNSDDLHELKYKFKAVEPAATDWGGASLTDGQKLVRVVKIRV